MIEDIKGGVRLHLFIQPKASKNQIVGIHDGEIKVKITAPPVDGEANAGLIAFLSKFFKIPKRDITLVRGEANRHKVIDIQGLDKARALRILNF